MKNFFKLFAALVLLGATSVQADDRLVGADLSMVAAYEQAGDQWLDETGKPIGDIIEYVSAKGWNAVRLRLFVNPDSEGDPAVCQDNDYVLAMAKRVKEANMALLLDLHYSDTWADPGTQKIPAAWTDHSTKALAANVYEYTHSVIKKFIDGDAAPDFVQIGNEITYGLLWNTSDGKYPTDAKTYATAGYCPTWSSNFNDGEEQWKRTAALLNKGAHAVRQAFAEAQLDSTDVKIVVHTEMGGNPKNSDNFYKHLRTAGFDNYDVVGLSYYPFWNGKLDVLGTLLSKLENDFPEKIVQIVETAWYNSNYPYTKDANNEYTIASLNSSWTADGQGMVSYINDLVAKLKLYNNVNGIYYWNPEECGKGYNKAVWSHNFNRGMWKSSEQQAHAMLMASDGTTPITALAQYLEDADIEKHTDASEYFKNLSFETGDLTGWTVEQEFLTLWPADFDASWMSSEVARGQKVLTMWNAKMTEGPIISQRANVPDGRYTITVKARANKKGFYVFAGGAKTAIPAEMPATWSVTTDANSGVLELGIGCKESTSDNYAYLDDFIVTCIGDATGEEDIDNTSEEDELKETEFIDKQEILYEINPAEKTAWVVDGTKASGEVIVPATITVDDATYSVTAIGKSAFLQNENLKAITIGKNVQSIAGGAFSDCWAMSKLNFEEGSGLKEIAAWSFNNSAIDSLDVPAGVTVIPEGAFAHCWALNYIALRGEVTRIEDFAFSDWSKADTLYANPSWMQLKKGMWIYAKQTPVISPKAFCPSDIAQDTLYVHYSLVEDSVYTKLGFAAVMALDESDGSVEYYDEQGVFYKLWPDNRTATVAGFDAAHAPQNVENWQITIPEAITINEEGDEYPVTQIADRAFYNHWTLTAVNLPDALIYIGDWAFFNTGLKKVVMPDRIMDIAEGVFSKCWQLESIEITGNINSIKDFAFSSWAETGCGSNGGKLQKVIIWSYPAPVISPKAFYAEDIAEATLYVDKSLVENEAYTSLNFGQVLPIDPDAVVSVKQTDDTNDKIYDLCGRQVTPLHHGLYIRNGKKYIK